MLETRPHSVHLVTSDRVAARFSSRDGGEILCDLETSAFPRFRKHSRDIAETELSFVNLCVIRGLELNRHFLRKEKLKPSSLSEGTGQ